MSLQETLNKINTGEWRNLLRKFRLGTTETVFLVSAILFMLSVVFFFATKVKPLNSQVAALEARENELRLKLNEINIKERKQNEQAANAQKILDSLDRFESYLKPDERGMTLIMSEIEALGKTNKVLVGDSLYKVEEVVPITDQNGNPRPQAGPNNKGNTYPAFGVETNVIGDYPNLRRFLLDLERSKQFLIISSLSFQGEADSARRAAAGGRPGPQVQLSPDAIPVSLKIEFQTYFQKPSNRSQ